MTHADARDSGDLDATLGKVMSSDVLAVAAECTVSDAAIRMRERGVGCVVVPGDGGNGIAGVFTERDVLMRVVAAGLDPRATRVGDVMTRNPTALDASTPVAVATDLVNQRGFRHLPVTASGRLVGIVSMRDLLRVRLRRIEFQLDEEVRALHETQELLAMDEQARTRALLSVNERLKELALTDELTGLYNHRYFVQRLAEEMSRATRLAAPVALVFADIDHFKRVNDTWGHPAGNRVLQQVAGVLRGTVEGADVVIRLRKSDVVTRYGGEEFAVLLTDASGAGALAVADRIRRGVEAARTTLADGTIVGVTVSLGVAFHPEHAADPEGLIRAADEALYRAKAGGRNRVECAGPARDAT